VCILGEYFRKAKVGVRLATPVMTSFMTQKISRSMAGNGIRQGAPSWHGAWGTWAAAAGKPKEARFHMNIMMFVEVFVVAAV
jgi:hypothetical protein